MKSLWKIGSVGVISIILIFALAACGGDDVQSTNEQSESQSETQGSTDQASEEKAVNEEESDENESALLTKEKYDKIKTGMTYEEVVEIIGSKGTVMSESGDAGSDTHTVLYEFDTDGFMSAATMMFQGGKLMSKAQAGLENNTDVEITLDEYNQLVTGMSSDEVFNIIGGEGEKTSETGEEGSDYYTVMYTYQGKGSLGANAVLMFQGDKLQSKSQFGLE